MDNEKRYKVEVFVQASQTWEPIRPTYDRPYTFASIIEAWEFVRTWYPDHYRIADRRKDFRVVPA